MAAMSCMLNVMLSYSCPDSCRGCITGCDCTYPKYPRGDRSFGSAAVFMLMLTYILSNSNPKEIRMHVRKLDVVYS